MHTEDGTIRRVPIGDVIARLFGQPGGGADGQADHVAAQEKPVRGAADQPEQRQGGVEAGQLRQTAVDAKVCIHDGAALQRRTDLRQKARRHHRRQGRDNPVPGAKVQAFLGEFEAA